MVLTLKFMPEGSKRTTIILAMLSLMILAVVVGAWYFSKAPHFLIYPDAMEYASVARSIAEGEGATTESLWILRLIFSTELPAPEVRRPLLLPYWSALWFKVFGVKDIVAIYSSAFWWFVLIGLTFWVGMKITGSLMVSTVATLLLIFDNVTLKLAFAGLTEPLFAVLFLLLAWALYRAEKPVHFLLAGVVIGVAQWSRTNAMFYLLPALFFVSRKDRKTVLLEILGLVGGFALAAFPIALRNQIVFGTFSLNPLYSYVVLNGTPIKPQHGMERSLHLISPICYYMLNPMVLLRKWINGFEKNFQILGMGIYPLCLGASLVFIDACREKRNLLLFIIFSFLLSLILFSIGEFEGVRFYAPLAPVLFIVVSDMIFQSGRISVRRTQKTLAFSLIAVSVIFTVNEILLTDSQEATRGYLDSFENSIERSVPENVIVVSDVPWTVAWRTGRTSVWLPYHPEELRVLEKYLPISTVVLSPAIATSAELAPKWKMIYQSRRLAGFRQVSDSPQTAIFVR